MISSYKEKENNLIYQLIYYHTEIKKSIFSTPNSSAEKEKDII